MEYVVSTAVYKEYFKEEAKYVVAVQHVDVFSQIKNSVMSITLHTKYQHTLHTNRPYIISCFFLSQPNAQIQSLSLSFFSILISNTQPPASFSVTFMQKK
jgi:hypothetical protein